MNLKLNIPVAHIDVKSGRSQRTGRDYSIAEQSGTVELPNGERRNISLQFEPGDAPFPVGLYEPKPSAIYCAKFGKLEISQRARDWQPCKKAT